MNGRMKALYGANIADLCQLAASLRGGSLSNAISRNTIRPLFPGDTDTIYECLQALKDDGLTPKQIALMVEAIAGVKETAPDPARLFELVLSGPDLAGIPTNDTQATMQMLMREAEKEVLLVGYAIYNGAELFAPLAQRKQENSNLKVTFCLDIRPPQGIVITAEEVLRRFAHEFRQHHWPWTELPEVYYDPRSLSRDQSIKASLHAKCLVIDRKAMLVTSANFTEAAQKKNIEMGILVRYAPMAARVAMFYEGLISARVLKQCLLF